MSTASGIPVLQTQNLCVRYGKVEALRAANITLHAGQIVTVIGPNGAGKSSLLNAIMGLLPVNGQAEGGVLYEGYDISHHAIEHRLGKGLALVPEKRELFTTMTVEDNLVLGAYRRRKAGWSYRDGLEGVYVGR
jgi:branched-chain amino acid transport system ATP-binding protein